MSLLIQFSLRNSSLRAGQRVEAIFNEKGDRNEDRMRVEYQVDRE